MTDALYDLPKAFYCMSSTDFQKYERSTIHVQGTKGALLLSIT